MKKRLYVLIISIILGLGSTTFLLLEDFKETQVDSESELVTDEEIKDETDESERAEINETNEKVSNSNVDLISEKINESVRQDEPPEQILIENDGESQIVITYSEDYFNPDFSLKLPNGYSGTSFQNTSGSWDILAENIEKDVVLIDYSGQKQKSFEDSLIDWLTNFGSYELTSEYSFLEQDKNENGNDYEIFQVDSTRFMGIINVNEIYGGQGHLIVNTSNLNLCTEIINSLVFIN